MIQVNGLNVKHRLHRLSLPFLDSLAACMSAWAAAASSAASATGARAANSQEPGWQDDDASSSPPAFVVRAHGLRQGRRGLGATYLALTSE